MRFQFEEECGACGYNYEVGYLEGLNAVMRILSGPSGSLGEVAMLINEQAEIVYDIAKDQGRLVR